MLTRTRITPAQTESLLLWLYSAALLLVAVRAELLATAFGPLAQVLLLLLPVVPVIMFLVSPRVRSGSVILFTIVDLAIVGAVYLLSGGDVSDARFLLYFVMAMAATRLRFEIALVLATLAVLSLWSGVISRQGFDLGLCGGSIAADLLGFYAVVIIFHLFVTRQKEVELRGSQELALKEAKLSFEKEQILARLGQESANASSLADILEIVLQAIRRFTPSTVASIALIDSNRRLYIAAADPPMDSESRANGVPLGDGITRWIADHQEPYYSPDLNVTGVSPSIRNGLRNSTRSFLGVPLITRGSCCGVIQVESATDDGFTLEHQKLLEAIGAQVAGALESARLAEERIEFSRKLQEVNETAHELTSYFDLDMILERFAHRAAELLNARYAAAAVFDAQGQITNFVTTGVAEGDKHLIGSPPEGRGVLGHVFHGQNPLRLEDVAKHPDSVGVPPHHPRMRTLLAAPLVARGERHGAIYVSEKLDGQPFSAADEELLTVLAAGASAAVSNARLYFQLRRNIEQLYSLHQIGHAMSSSLSWEDVIRVFNRDVKRLCGAEMIVISQLNPHSNRLVSLSREAPVGLLDVHSRPALYEQLTRTAQSTHPASLSVTSNNGDASRLYGIAVPLNVRGNALGLAEMYSHSSSLVAPESSSLFLTLVAQLAVGMENTRLYGELQRREQQLRNFVVRLFQAQDDERRRMAYDVHDGLAQLIVSADLHLSNFVAIRGEDPLVAEADLVKGLARVKAALAEVRRVVAELRPSTLDDFGLVKTLRRHIEELAAEQAWEFTFEENLGEARLDPTLENGAFRIAQESLNNARKHSNTRRVRVDLRHEGDLLRINVQDWGEGFDAELLGERAGHFGMSGMEERARLLGGSCQIESQPGQGTTVKVELPYYEAARAAIT